MKKRIVRLFILLFILIFHGSIVQAYENILLEVGLTRAMDSSNQAVIEASGELAMFDENEALIRSFGSRQIKISLKGEDIILSSESSDFLAQYPGTGQYWFRAQENDGIQVNGKRYRGYIAFKSRHNKLIIINHVRLEDYLRGVVPKEMSSTNPMEALKAQAVASRSFAIANQGKMAKKGYELDDTTTCQVYGGLDAETPATDQAVHSTRGIVAKYNGKVANTIFFASSSGYTENAKDVWGADLPYLSAVQDEFTVRAPLTEWDFEIDSDELEKKLRSAGYMIQDIRRLSLNFDKLTSRVKEVFIDSATERISLPSSTFRNLMGNTRFKSTTFQFMDEAINHESQLIRDKKDLYVIDGLGDIKQLSEREELGVLDSTEVLMMRSYASVVANFSSFFKELPDSEKSFSYDVSQNRKIRFRGRGYGHGVGMSQAGSKVMAKEGYQYEEILKFYYKGIEVGY